MSTITTDKLQPLDESVQHDVATMGIETVVDGNDTFIKYPDGTMIATGIGATASAWITKTFSEAFVVAPIVTGNVINLRNASVHSIKFDAITTTSFDVACPNGSSYATLSYNWIAIGRWK